MTLDLSREVGALLDRLAEERETGAVVVTGAGDIFCAGGDVKIGFLAGDDPRGPALARLMRFIGGFAGITHRRGYPKPLIAAVNGAAIGGGFELCLACDLVVAEEHAIFSLPEVRAGRLAGSGGAMRLPQRIPRVVAHEMILTGEAITAPRALELGLVNRVVARGAAATESVALARRILESPPDAVRAATRLMRAAAELAEDELWRRNDDAVAELIRVRDGDGAPSRSPDGRP
jgi:enoyl-CoA hydratase